MLEWLWARLSLSGTAKATWNICGGTRKWLTAYRCSLSYLIELERLCQEQWEKLAKSRSAMFVETYPRWWIAAKGASTKQWMKGLNRFQFLIIGYYRLLYVHRWAKIYNKVCQKERGLNTFQTHCILIPVDAEGHSGVLLWATRMCFTQHKTIKHPNWSGCNAVLLLRTTGPATL